MIEIDIHPGQIAVSGHAEYAPQGQDIVCAAVSTLVQTLSASIMELTEDVAQGCEMPGKSILITKHLSDEKTKLLIDAFLVGVNMIADTYPDHVRIIWAGVEPIKATD